MTRQIAGRLPWATALRVARRPRRDQANHLALLRFDHLQRGRKVGVVRNDHRTILLVQPGIIEYVQREVDIRALLLGLPYLYGVRGRIRVLHSHAVAQEVAEVDLDERAILVETTPPRFE